MIKNHRVTENAEIIQLNKISEKIIACAIEVHKNLGAGLLEIVYELALCVEFEHNNIQYQRQVTIPILYKGHLIGEHRLDLLVENKVIVEIKSVNKSNPVFEAQLLSYMKITGNKLGLLINFNVPKLKQGIKRMIL